MTSTDLLFDAPGQHPLPEIRSWFEHAIEQGVSEPGAMAFATVGRSGCPSNRIIQLLDVTREGLVFATHAQSLKGREIEHTSWGSGVLYWRELKRQMTVSGHVLPLPDTESDRLWEARPLESRAMSSVSRQSAVLHDEQSLRESARQMLSAPALPRPAGWKGYVLRPAVVEFWEFSPDRLYKRLRYEAVGSNWSCWRLQP
jgi:pyridoxamine 5'-phosphate oxidase